MKIIIFAGGVGSRLWPLSRKNTPKQFGKLIGESSTLQETVARLFPTFSAQDMYISTGEGYKDIVMEQLSMIPKENFVFEPTRRDVGPAIGLMSVLLEKKFSDEPIAILWSDHIVKKAEKFRTLLLAAEERVLSKKSDFVFIAQKARFANQNCGWIELGEQLDTIGNEQLFQFKQLIYGPSPEDAEKFFADLNYVWNLGYFVTTPKFLSSLFAQFVPEMYEKLQKIKDAYGTPSFEATLSEVYPTFDKISFDHAILMKMQPDRFTVFSADLGWSDVGAWDALKEGLSQSIDENVSNGNVLLEQSSDSIAFNYVGKQLVVGIDLKEMIIVNTEDVLLVCPKSSVPKIKKFVEGLEKTANEHLA